MRPGEKSAAVLQIVHAVPVELDEVEVLSEILLTSWDPIGAAETDIEPQSEYLYEARVLLNLLVGGASVEQLADYLTEQGLGSNRERDVATARRVAEWYTTRS